MYRSGSVRFVPFDSPSKSPISPNPRPRLSNISFCSRSISRLVFQDEIGHNQREHRPRTNQSSRFFGGTDDASPAFTTWTTFQAASAFEPLKSSNLLGVTSDHSQ